MPQKVVMLETGTGYSWVPRGDPDFDRFFRTPTHFKPPAGQALPTLLTEQWRITSQSAPGVDGTAVIVLESD
jgi:hypothetical protein